MSNLSEIADTPAAAPEIDRATLHAALTSARRRLLDARAGASHWTGRLSSSALSTATAVCALRDVSASEPGEEAERWRELASRGLLWLAEKQKPDGGWGDTTASFSNISTTALCWAAFAGAEASHPETVGRCERWLSSQAGGLEREQLAAAIRARYGKDHTFSVPILTALALSGRLGDDGAAWDSIPQLPFELAACPHAWFAALRLPVVSYALPALIAIGQVRHRRRPSRNPLLRLVRNAVSERTLRKLLAIQPASGGYLEATPLTSFVVMSLVGAGLVDHAVVAHGVEFLVRSVRDDGSWAIDTDLATWTTTLSVRALGECEGVDPGLSPDEASDVLAWLLQQQYRVTHPYTQAAPGGWAWTDLPGGVPDADDTPGALLALAQLGQDERIVRATAAGVRWLLDLQNGDGGIPTFCRGWGALPFDQSSPDLTAHTLRAWRVAGERIGPSFARRIERARRRALAFLRRQQRPDGSWTPLWFGNQHASDEENPVYGTSRVLLALLEEFADGATELESPVSRGVAWLLAAQNEDGGWGGAAGCPSSIEESSLAIEAVAAAAELLRSEALPTSHSEASLERMERSLRRGAHYLLAATDMGRRFSPTPIGFYFAKLWYFEELYPLIFATTALGRLAAYWRDRDAAPPKGGG